MKIAIVHDYLVNRGGAERVVASLHRVFPDAPIFTGLYAPEHTYPDFADADVRTSGLQKLLRDPASFRRLAPLMPRAFRRMRLEGFDAVLSSTTGFGHHVRPDGACHITYVHAPPRFLWNASYRRSDVVPAPLRPFAGLAVRALRRSDRKAAAGPHATIVNSKVTAERVRALYGREATIIHPPVDVNRFRIAPNTRDEFLLVSRLLDHKNIDVAVRTFTSTGRRLIIAGDGPARGALEALAGPSIEFRGSLDDQELAKLYGRCRGVVVTSEEEFGITPLEAAASGRPVVALRAGGALETVVEGVTGLFFTPANPAALQDAVERAVATSFDPAVLRRHAEQWSESVFASRIRSFVERTVAACMTCERTRRANGNVRHLPFRRNAGPAEQQHAAVKP